MTDAPHSIEAEQQVLGAILGDNRLLDRVSITPEDFFDPVHRLIFEVARARVRSGQRADPVTLKAIIGTDEGLRQMGGPSYLARLVGVAMPSGLPSYAAQVVELHAKRVLLSALLDGAAAVNGQDDVATLVSRLQGALTLLPEVEGQDTVISSIKAMTNAVERAAQAYQGQGRGVRTGIASLDRVLGRLGPGDLCLVCGSTSMGKTSVALEITRHVAQADPVLFWSREMEPEQLMERMAAARARVKYSDLRRADEMEEADFRAWIKGAQDTGDSPFGIIPKRIRDVPGALSAARRAQGRMSKPLGLLVVDYAQIVQGRGNSRYEQQTNVSTTLKDMGGELGCPVIALCQLDRNIGERPDRRPQLSDIKETGQYENDADQVVMCHREEYWLQKLGPRLSKSGEVTADARADWEAAKSETKNRLELIVRKNRGGACMTAETMFHAPTMRFWPVGEGE